MSTSTHPAEPTTVHTPGDGEPDAYLVNRAIPATSDAALAFIRGETAAAAYLARMARDLVQPGELAQRIGATDPALCGFLHRVEKCLIAQTRGVSV